MGVRVYRRDGTSVALSVGVRVHVRDGDPLAMLDRLGVQDAEPVRKTLKVCDADPEGEGGVAEGLCDGV